MSPEGKIFPGFVSLFAENSSTVKQFTNFGCSDDATQANRYAATRLITRFSRSSF